MEALFIHGDEKYQFTILKKNKILYLITVLHLLCGSTNQVTNNEFFF